MHIPIHSETFYRYEHQHGFISTDENQHDAMIFSGADLIAISQEKFEIESAALSAKRLMRLILSHLLGNKPLYSRDLF